VRLSVSITIPGSVQQGVSLPWNFFGGVGKPANRMSIYKNDYTSDITIPLIFARTQGYSSYEPLVLLVEDVDKIL
jgi:hypothetical protein